MDITMRITAAADYIRAKTSLQPEIGLILGSGLGDYADTLENAVRIPFADIPGFPVPTVAGHSGALVADALPEIPDMEDDEDELEDDELELDLSSMVLEASAEEQED